MTVAEFPYPLETQLRDGHTFVVVRNTRECSDFNWLIGQRALIDGHPYKVLGVELFMHGAPWAKGETIGLLVDAAPLELCSGIPDSSI